jgi:hypothetical protein
MSAAGIAARVNKMDAKLDQLRRRFRLALVGYLVLAAFCVAGLIVFGIQQSEIKETQQRVEHNARQLAELLSAAQFQLCLQAGNSQADCKARQRSAAEVYDKLTH